MHLIKCCHKTQTVTAEAADLSDGNSEVTTWLSTGANGTDSVSR